MVISTITHLDGLGMKRIGSRKRIYYKKKGTLSRSLTTRFSWASVVMKCCFSEPFSFLSGVIYCQPFSLKVSQTSYTPFLVKISRSSLGTTLLTVNQMCFRLEPHFKVFHLNSTPKLEGMHDNLCMKDGKHNEYQAKFRRETCHQKAPVTSQPRLCFDVPLSVDAVDPGSASMVWSGDPPGQSCSTLRNCQ